MKTDSELMKEYIALMKDERDIIERKIKLTEEMRSSDGVWKDFGNELEDLKRSLFRIKMLMLFYTAFCEECDKEEIEAFMETEEFKKYGNESLENK